MSLGVYSVYTFFSFLFIPFLYRVHTGGYLTSAQEWQLFLPCPVHQLYRVRADRAMCDDC
jgi:hypothetical protein